MRLRLLLIVPLLLLVYLRPGGANVSEAAYPGTNGKIVFTSSRDGNGEVYSMDPDGTEQTRLTVNAASDGQPEFSPDGSKIAFASTRDGSWEIYVMNANGTSQTRLTFDTADDTDPTWAPDGFKLAFSSTRDGNPEIYTMNADGSSQTRLTISTANEGEADWSPIGSKIVFVTNRDAGNYDIYTMNTDGSAQTRVTTNAAGDHAPHWSPDATKIAFHSGRDGNFEIYSMSADGTGQTRLTNNPATDGQPAWSPDGSKIVFGSERVGPSEIYVMNADGSDQSNLTDSAGVDWNSNWQAVTASTDVDGDGVPDGYENAHPCLDPNAADASADPDADLLTNIDEYARGTDPCDPDSDHDAAYAGVHGDGCADGRELLLSPQTAPLNPWDFYSVPLPALFAASNPIGLIRDGVVAAADAQAVFAYFGAGARQGVAVYDQDLNGNSVADGIEYDRSFAGPGMSGPPNGVVTAADAQLAFAQFVRAYHC